MRILVICGAGASSTFVAQRLRHAAHDAGLDFKAIAGTPQSLLVDLDEADLVLVGPHLAGSLDAIERDASARGAAAALLPDDIFGDLDGSRTLALVQAVLARTEPAGEAGRGADTTRRMT
jgi:PTS system cellobiose-specific IIB component